MSLYEAYLDKPVRELVEKIFTQMEGIQKLQEANKVLREAVEYYGNVNNWKRSNKTFFGAISCIDAEELTFEYKPLGYHYNKKEIAGRLARQALAKADEIMREAK